MRRKKKEGKAWMNGSRASTTYHAPIVLESTPPFFFGFGYNLKDELDGEYNRERKKEWRE